MAIYTRINVIKVMLVVFFAFVVPGLVLPWPSFAEQEITAQEAELVVLPENRILWTRDANPAGSELSWTEAHEFLADLNSENYAGCRQWRLPSREELAEMLTYLDSGNADNGDISPELDDYWAFASNGLESDYADVVNMEDGSIDSHLKSDSNYVWPVCDR